MPDSAVAPLSKTELKRRMHELQRLGAALAELPDVRLDAMPLAEPLRDALRELQRTRSHEGRRRQLQYVGKLMRQADPEPLREAIAAERLGSARETLALHAAERWRDELLTDEAALARWMAEHPASDARQLERLVRAARHDAASRPPARHRAAASGAADRKGRAYRDLFQFIKRHHHDDE